jgi:hypothetical protein
MSAATVKDSADRRPEPRRLSRGRGRRLQLGAVVVGAMLAATCLDGVAFAWGRDGGVPLHSGTAGVTIAAKPDKPGKGERGGGEDRGAASDERRDQGAGLGQLAHGVDGGRADDLAGELRNCLDAEDVEDMRGGQVKHLAHAAGLSEHELKDLLAKDDDSERGLGRLARGSLSEAQADNVADELRDQLEAEDLEDLKLGHLLQAAHACGITTQDLKESLAED